jgi:hypothetical protein
VPTEIGMIIGVGMRLAGRRADHGGGAPVLDDYDVVSAPRCVCTAYGRPTERAVAPYDLAHTVGESSYLGITTAESVEVFRAFLDRGVN